MHQPMLAGGRAVGTNYADPWWAKKPIPRGPLQTWGFLMHAMGGPDTLRLKNPDQASLKDPTPASKTRPPHNINHPSKDLRSLAAPNKAKLNRANDANMVGVSSGVFGGAFGHVFDEVISWVPEVLQFRQPTNVAHHEVSLSRANLHSTTTE